MLPDCVKNVLNRSFTAVNSLSALIFALPENKIFSPAKASLNKLNFKKSWRAKNRELKAQRRFRKVLAAQYMHVQMEHRLPGTGTVVNNQAKGIADTGLLSNLASS